MNIETQQCPNTATVNKETATVSRSGINTRCLFYMIAAAIVPITKAVQSGRPVGAGVILEAISLALLAWRGFVDISVARAEPPTIS